MNEILELKTIEELKNYKFIIPSYQRGYRWTKKEVVELLEDISNFTPKLDEDDNKSWYCLQPIVIKKKGDYYEVIDGQQRLTTIFLILHYINQLFVKNQRKKIFELDYETRKEVSEFLNNLTEGTHNSENIDFYYISQAYKVISNWVNKDNFDIFDFNSKFNFNSKVIWYECNEDDAISIFTRINMGKIPLTNAELIKALFLNSSNFNNNYNDEVRLKQLEISSEWDRIEKSLQNDSFWYFINHDEKLTNRIDYIFQLMNPNTDDKDKYSTFRYFSTKFQEKDKDKIEENWLEVKQYFQTLEEWYNERELYHKIGFLVSEGISIDFLVENSLKKKKNKFKEFLDKQIKYVLSSVEIDELQYGDGKVKTVLLLYNIQTMLANASENSRFPFDIYKKEKWDIEHITSVKDSMPKQKKHKELWLNDAIDFIEEKDFYDEVIQNRSDEFEEIYEKVVDYFNEYVKDNDINEISNLALLDSSTNRGYKNAVFPVKRKTIIQKEKAGKFIPICTKNAFLKYFSEYPPKMSFWTQEDKEKYYDDIVRVLEKYLEY